MAGLTTGWQTQEMTAIVTTGLNQANEPATAAAVAPPAVGNHRCHIRTETEKIKFRPVQFKTKLMAKEDAALQHSIVQASYDVVHGYDRIG
jgi:hypothetical protein